VLGFDSISLFVAFFADRAGEAVTYDCLTVAPGPREEDVFLLAGQGAFDGYAFAGGTIFPGFMEAGCCVISFAASADGTEGGDGEVDGGSGFDPVDESGVDFSLSPVSESDADSVTGEAGAFGSPPSVVTGVAIASAGTVAATAAATAGVGSGSRW
jgi:hypothetical protein